MNERFLFIPSFALSMFIIYTIDKLSKMNPGFKKFIYRVWKDLESNEVRKEQYDKILSEEKLLHNIGG